MRSKISFAVRQISLRVPTRRGRAVGVAALWGHTLSADSDGGIIQTLPLRPPKLVNLKYTNQLQTVNLLLVGWRGVANKGTSPRACGWEAYLPLNLSRRSGARHQPFPYWQFLDRTPYIICFTSASIFVVGAQPVLGALL